MTDIAVEIAEEHLVDGPKEPLDTAAALRLTWYREHQPHLEIGCYLLQVLRGKVGIVVCVKDVWYAADLPVRMPFTPYPLAQSKRKTARQIQDNSRRSLACNRRSRS